MVNEEELVKIITEYSYGTWRAQKDWKAPLFITDAEGPYFYDAAGKRYLDFSSQLMCVNLGHKNKAIIEAICEQVKKLSYVAPSFACEIKAKAVKALLEVMPKGYDPLYLCDFIPNRIYNKLLKK